MEGQSSLIAMNVVHGLKRAFVADNPIARAAQITALARLVGLIAYFFGTDPNGQPISAAPLVVLPFAAAYHLGSVWLVMCVYLAIWKAAPAARAIVEWAAVGTFALIIVLAQADLDLIRLTGNSLTLGILRAYVGPSLWTRDILGPMTNDAGHSLVTTAVVAGAIVWSALTVVRSRRRATGEPPSWRWIGAWLIVGMAITGWRRSGAFLNPTYGWPVEARLLASALRLNRTAPPRDERATMAELRSLIRLRPGQVWLDEQYPLLRGPLGPASAAGADAPDIVIIAIEALRGVDVGYLKSPMDDRYVPNLSRLAAQSVVFPKYIANATTSSTGFFSINCSGWRHPGREILGEFSHRSFDCLPTRLRSAGYFTMYLNASNPGFDRQLDWARPMFDVVDYRPPVTGIYNDNINEELLVDKFLSHLAQHDATQPGQPLFAYAATYSTHPPYILDTPTHDLPAALSPGTTGITPLTMPDPHERYLSILRYTDGQLQRIIAALATRPRADNTVLIVVGDHSVSLTEPDPPEPMPFDMYSYTGALIAGPAHLIGTPRRDTISASHADLSATILKMVGDTRPTASLGNDLLGGARPPHQESVALRPAGYRMDRDGCSLFVYADNPKLYWAQRSFTGTLPAVAPDSTCTFTSDDARRLDDLTRYWSYLVEQDRVWRPSFLGPQHKQ